MSHLQATSEIEVEHGFEQAEHDFLAMPRDGIPTEKYAYHLRSASDP